jgi:hypothetical protein
MNDQDEYPYSRNRWLPWLLERGLCDPETAAEYVGRKLLSQEVFAQARQEYKRVTANYTPPYHAPFTRRKPDERALLEIWHISYGPNVSYLLCVTDPNLLLERSSRAAARSGRILRLSCLACRKNIRLGHPKEPLSIFPHACQ